MAFISILANIILLIVVGAVVLYIVRLIMGALEVPAKLQQIVIACLGLIFLLYFLGAVFGVAGVPRLSLE